MSETHKILRLPPWFRRSLPEISAGLTHHVLAKHRLNTVCESAICPNRSECYAEDTATFMILGNSCTRRCGFCAVPTGKGEVLEKDEPRRVASAAKELGLKYVVVTSVARDDLADEGANHFAETIRAIYEEIPDSKVEVLTPDFHARKDLLEIVVAAKPVVFNHNVETVKRFQKQMRPQARYDRSLDVLRLIKEINPEMLTKSGLMLGIGETDEEIWETCRNLLEVKCDILTLGQYLRPGIEYQPVSEYIHPEKFTWWARELKALGFQEVFAGPFVRSSYHAGEAVKQCR